MAQILKKISVKLSGYDGLVKLNYEGENENEGASEQNVGFNQLGVYLDKLYNYNPGKIIRSYRETNNQGEFLVFDVLRMGTSIQFALNGNIFSDNNNLGATDGRGNVLAIGQDCLIDNPEIPDGFVTAYFEVPKNADTFDEEYTINYGEVPQAGDPNFVADGNKWKCYLPLEFPANNNLSPCIITITSIP